MNVAVNADVSPLLILIPVNTVRIAEDYIRRRIDFDNPGHGRLPTTLSESAFSPLVCYETVLLGSFN